MKFNKAKLQYYMIKKNVQANVLAAQLGINTTTLYRKMNENSDFYRHEILRIKDELDLSTEEMNEIFFS